MKRLFMAIGCFSFATSAAFAGECDAQHKITKKEIFAVQDAWGKGIVAIGAAQDHKKAAMEHINTLYGYDMGAVLFKPTKASVVEFRDTKEEAISYFVGGKEREDKGFALAPFIKVRFDNKGIIIDCDSALAMGNYYFTSADGKETKVDYSFGYVRGSDGHLKINLHHSSLPYTPE
jgi:hypothetical protein